MRRLAAATVLLVCATTLVGCSPSDDASSDPSPAVTSAAPDATETDVAQDAADTADAADDQTGKPGSIAEFATMLQDQAEASGQNEMSIGDVSVSQSYAADGDTLIITTTYGEGFEVPADTTTLTSTMDQVIAPLGEQLLPMAQQVSAGAKVTLDVAVADGTVIYTKTFE